MNKAWRNIEAEVFFYENARSAPPFGEYRPHFVADGSEDYLGIQFIDLKNAPFGERIVSKVELVYEDLGVDYSQLAPNNHFVIQEGAKSVGEGFIIGKRTV